MVNDTNRELLEFAAKAAGLPHKWIPMLGKMLHIIDGGNSDTWNPLDNDGDAFRLAVKLHLLYGINTDILNHYITLELSSDDTLAATRRAIVRAAAEIGMQMP